METTAQGSGPGAERDAPEVGGIDRTPAGEGAGLSRDSTVLALVPHYHCEPWLPDCLDSLLAQTRPLQNIVVIDDGSGDPPVEIVRQYPRVTLLASARNVGPFRLMQSVIEATQYDAYLFQDADDWSARERLMVLLEEAERTGSELVGSRAVRVDQEQDEMIPLYLPLDCNAALAIYPTVYPMLLGTCLVSRRLVMSLGGFATGLRYGADPEFVRRAAHATRVTNVPSFTYFYRKRASSLTGSRSTALESPERLELMRKLHERAEQNAALVVRGKAPDLAPFKVDDPISLDHLAGPELQWTHGRHGLWRR